MFVSRREMLRLLGAAGLALPAVYRLGRAVQAQSAALGLRSVTSADATALRDIMSICVNGTDPFYGKCGVWTLNWAQDFIGACPASIVLTQNGAVMAFMQIPPIGPAPQQLSPDATPDAQQQFAISERSRTTFRVNAGGIRADLLSTDDAVRMFYTLIYWTFKTAQQMGYAYATAWAPWEQHPLFDKKWTDYPGCTLAQPVVHAADGSRDMYFLQWQLDLAVTALEAEERFDVA